MAVLTYSHKLYETWYVSCCSCLHSDDVLLASRWVPAFWRNICSHI